MDWSLLVSGLGLLVLSLTAIDLVQKWQNRRRIISMMKCLPGPKHWPIIGCTLEFIISSAEIIKIADKFIKECGPIVGLWAASFTCSIISKDEYVETLLSNTEEITKGDIYKFLVPWLGTGLLTANGHKWHLHRKMLTPSFHFSNLESFMETFHEKSQILINKLQKMPSGQVHDLYPHITLCSLDIICEAVMGVNMNTQDPERKDDKKSAYISSVYKVTEATVYRYFRLWLYPAWIFYNLSSVGRAYYKGIQLLHDYSNKVVGNKVENRKARKSNDSEEYSGTQKKNTFLDLLLEAAGENHILSKEEVREEVDTFMFEGHDTTTSAICWSIFLLGNHSDIQDKVVDELNRILEDDLERKFTSADLKEMKYLERVVKEALRLYPSVPFFDRTLKNDLKMGGYTLPAGSDVRVSTYHLHRSPENFPDPEKFNPDNFLPDKIKNRHPYAYVPFSAGPRNCIGQKFAMMEVKSVLAAIFLNFKVESIEKPEDITLMAELILRPKSGLKVKLYPRMRNH